MDLTEILLIVTYSLGCLICVLLSANDFRGHVPPYQKSKLRILAVSLLFIIVVLVVYVGLVYVLAGIGISNESPYIIATDGTSYFTKFRFIAPILISILYFGATKACLTIGNKEICVYDRLLQVFVGFLSIPLNQEALLRVIKQKQVDALQTFHKQCIDQTGGLGIKVPQEDQVLEETRKEFYLNSDRIAFLEDIITRKESIDDAKMRVQQDLDKSRELYIEKLKNVVNNLIKINTSNPHFADFTIKYFEIAPTTQPKREVKVLNLFIRTIAMAIIGALPMALIYNQGSDYEVVSRIFLIASALFVFLFWFIWLSKFSWSLDHAFKVLMLGIIAGASGAIAFDIVGSKEGMVLKWLLSKLTGVAGNGDNFSFENLFNSVAGRDILKGLLMGATASLIVYCFRYVMVKKIRNMLVLFAFLAGAGFTFFAIGELLWLSVSRTEFLGIFDYMKEIWPDCATVAVLSVVIGLVSNVLHIESWSLGAITSVDESLDP